MDIKHMVLADHANIRQLMDQIDGAATTAGVGGRDRLFEQLMSELERHFRLMQDVIAPALGKTGRNQSNRPGEDEVLSTAGELARADKRQVDWAPRFNELRNDLDHLFAKHTQMITGVSDVTSAWLTKDYAKAKKRAILSAGYLSQHSMGRMTTIAGSVLAALAVGATLFGWLRARSGDSDATHEPTLSARELEGRSEASVAAE